MSDLLLLPPQLTANWLERHDRYRAVVRSAIHRMNRLRHDGAIDEVFLADYRESLDQAGATDEHIRASASVLVWTLIQGATTEAGVSINDLRDQLEQVAEHFLRRDFTVRRASLPSLCAVAIEFPDQPRVQ
jgi:hypothetical protein